MTPKLKKIIIIVIILVLAFIAYSVFFKKSEEKDTLISSTNTLGSSRSVEETKILGQQITQALLQIELLRLDKAVFSNPVFVSLEDRSEPILAQPVGRKNPFAPLSDTSVNYSSSRIPIIGDPTAVQNNNISLPNITNATSTATSSSS
jgi:hypothetical protein